MKIIIKKVFIRKAKLQKRDNFDKSFKLKFKYNL